MKRLILLGFMGLITAINAQIPDAFSYQAVIRDNDQTLIKNQTVTVKATILRNEEVIFTQTQTATTNENGLLTIEIGNESFQEINWLDGPLFIKTEIDTTGENNFMIETETQLLTVPYSMTAKTAETAMAVTGLDFLIERIENLEAQVEELYFHLGIPIEVPFEEYTLTTPHCSWMPVNTHCHCYLEGGGEVVFVNSYEELENYAYCLEGYTLPEIDFSANTLLVTCGYTPGEPGFVENIELIKISSNHFLLNLDVFSGPWAFIDLWRLGIIVQKLPENTIVELNVTMYDF
ncbi:MAG: Ig-like domain-containing protein [Marinilabiliaceae bacterium]|nr:Ig-like domain-containing protein [Marinilabiliaceae bacterium]